MKLLKKNILLKLPDCQIQAVLSDPVHRIKIKGVIKGGGDILTAEDKDQNAEFARICEEMTEDKCNE